MGLKEKAFETWDEGEKMGCLKSPLAKASVEVQGELDQEDQKKNNYKIGY
ncbi:hypothetical protein [Chryseobacterium herbae]|uniref:Mersacidin/lichenicidin family type 2 lantibiotic n=1 Tax=Chryseobacterium herbae TaxID=2976476 RepID=A0ABT2ITH2_9FLAO|nr:hypothetical protein [Chryseobacterium sp. pc1-10]MCT2562117.1 hypothetical protein [Chryseobacterium sp. pc1-10]